MNSFKTLFVIALSLAVGAACWGSSSSSSTGSSTPPTDLPAPVAHLYISSPDTDGNVRVTAEAGTADVGSNATIINTSQNSSSWLDVFTIRQAVAATSVTVTVESDGSFQGEVEASVGDTISVSYTSSGSTTSAESTAPSGAPALPLTGSLFNVAINKLGSTAAIVGNDGSDGLIHLVDLSDSSLDSTITLSGASGANLIAINPTTGMAVVIDTSNDTIWTIDLQSGNSQTGPNPIGSVTDLAIGTTSSYAILSHDVSGYSESMTFYNLDSQTNSFVSFLVSEFTATPSQNVLVDIVIDSDDINDIVGIVSLYDDGNYYLHLHTVDTTTPALSTRDAILLEGITDPQDMILISNGDEALVSDATNDVVKRIHFANDTLTSITVDKPKGMVLSSDGATAYIVSQDDRILHSLTLSDNTLATKANLGLTPTKAALDRTGSNAKIVVLNTEDKTVTITE